MDFALDPVQRELRDLAAQVFGGLATTERVAAAEATHDRIDHRLWRALAEAGLVGAALDERWDGGGCGVVELALILQQQGRHVAPVPLWPTLALAALPIARHGSDEQRARWLPRVAAGTCMLTGAFEDLVAATPVADGYELSGRLRCVPAAHLAERVLVLARTPDDRRLLALVDPARTDRERAVTTDRQVAQHLRLDAVLVRDAVELSPDAVDAMIDTARVLLCAVHVGVVERALELTAGHLRTRRQFGRELGTFQSVALRAADAAIDLEAMRLTSLQAAWLVARDGRAPAEVAAARWWAAEAGRRAIHAAMHLHGGIGNDVDYPLHRYFLWSQQLGTTLGGPSEALDRLATAVVDSAPAVALGCR